MDDIMQIKKLYANIGKLITSSLDLDTILEGIMEEVHVFFDAANWSLMRLDPNTNELFFVIVQGIDRSAVMNIRLGPGEGIAGLVAKTGQSIFVPDTSRDTRFSNRIDRVSGFETKSVIAVPLVFRGTIYGVIEIVNRTTGIAFSEDEHLILQTIADFAAIAFANRFIYEKALQIANTDPLTGLNNRARLEELIGQFESMPAMSRRAHDRGRFFVAVMADIDDFKAVNDRLGHRAGDMLLKRIAGILSSCIRNDDMVFRLGGDEFLALMSCTSLSEADNSASRIRSELEKTSRFAFEKGFQVSFSIGVSFGSSESLREIIHDADMKMYEFKRANKEKDCRY